MPRFFFHVRYADGVVVPDTVGIDFSDLAAAIADARVGITQTVDEKRQGSEPVKATAIEIFDEDGALLRTIPFTRPERSC